MAAFFALGIVFRHAAPTPRADGVGGPLMALRGHRDANYHRASQSCLRAPYEKSTPARGLSCGELVLSGGGGGFGNSDRQPFRARRRSNVSGRRLQVFLGIKF